MKDFLSVFSTITLQRIPHLNVGLRVAISGSLLDYKAIVIKFRLITDYGTSRG
jgi:hypothetical protein